MRVLYSADNRRSRLGVALLVLIVGAVAMGWLAIEVYVSYGLNPADGYGGRLAPWTDRAWFAGFLGATGFGLLFAVWLVLRLFVRKISKQDDDKLAGNGIQIHFFGPFAPLDLHTEEVRGVHAREGRLNVAGAPGVDAPYYLIFRRGRRLPLVLDAQGEFYDRPGLRAVLPLS